MKLTIYLIILMMIIPFAQTDAQEMSLYQQFNGRFDFTIFGNTLNIAENGQNVPCEISTSSSASLVLAPDDNIVNAYLYWAGSGSGDFSVKLNDEEIEAERTWNLIQNTTQLEFFSGFADVTDQLINEGAGTFTISDLDLTAIIPDYCPNATNFGGWAILVVYENLDLPINQLNVYDGLDYVGQDHAINITLDNLNVIDNDGAKIGFLAWEGDRSIQLTESLTFNGTPLSNTYNPSYNAFNSTNSIIGSTALYNMDIDVYNIENLIVPGSSSAEIALFSGQDFVMINVIATVLNSQLPDATVSIDNVEVSCNSQSIIAEFTISNLNSTDPLPAATPIAVYADGIFVNYTETLAPLEVGESVSDVISLVIPPQLLPDFTLTFVVDDDGNGVGSVIELNENNNSYEYQVSVPFSPEFNQLPTLFSCNLGLTKAVFDFSAYEDLVKVDMLDVVTFHETQQDAENGVNAIADLFNYEAFSTPKQIFVRITSANSCYSVTYFNLQSRNCPPKVYNFVSANNDNVNDTFFIEGLRDIFVNFKLSVYNRYGVLIWTGNNSQPDWNGIPTKGMLLDGNCAPDGTYYYVLELNDENYPEPLTGFLYLNK